MKYGSLFTGIGGFDLALDRAGFVSAWMCEIDKNCQNVLRKHFSGVKIYDNIKEIGEGTEPVDVLVGGFPCQDLSVAGKREGLNGERSGLWFEFKRVIEILRPEWVVAENVPGLLSSNGGRDFATVLQGLDELGYGVCWRVFDSQYFGVPQRRRRVFIVGHLGDGRASQVLFEPESEVRDSKKGRKTREKTPNDTATNTLRGFGHGWQGQHNDTNPVIENYKNGENEPVLAHETGKGFWTEGLPGLRGQPGGMPENIIAIQNTLVDRDKGGPEGIGVNESGTMYTMDASGQPHAVAITYAVRTAQTMANGIGVAEDITHTLDGANAQAIAWNGAQITSKYNSSGVFVEKTPTMNHMNMNMVAYNTNDGNSAGVRIQVNADKSVTLQSGGGGMSAKTGMYTTPMGVRRLTPVECERLQGFPDGWTDGQADTIRYRQLGNAVTVNVVEWIARRIASL